MSMKAAAMPWPALIFFTIARARTSPLGTSNTIFITVPTGAGLGVAINNPPNPNVTTRDTERPPLCCHATSMPLGSFTRRNLRFTVLVPWLRTTPLLVHQLVVVLCSHLEICGIPLLAGRSLRAIWAANDADTNFELHSIVKVPFGVARNG